MQRAWRRTPALGVSLRRTAGTLQPEAPAEAFHEVMSEQDLGTPRAQEAQIVRRPKRGSRHCWGQAGPNLPCPEAGGCVK